MRATVIPPGLGAAPVVANGLALAPDAALLQILLIAFLALLPVLLPFHAGPYRPAFLQAITEIRCPASVSPCAVAVAAGRRSVDVIGSTASTRLAAPAG